MNPHTKEPDLDQRLLRYEPCELESIRTCGHIQSYGIFFGVTPEDLNIRYVSNEVSSFYAGNSTELLGQNLSDIVFNAQSLNRLSIIKKNSSVFFHKLFQGKGGKYFDVLVHHSSQNLLLLECFDQAPPHSIPEVYWTSIFDMSEAEIYDCLFSHLDHIVDYHRALIYKFEADGSGVVIKEHIKSTTSAETTRYLGLHYPATDIPKVVRDLYLENPLRYIADINTCDSPIISVLSEKETGTTVSHLDLTKLVSRGVSPFHIRYLRNMGVSGSCSCAIILQNKLWGLLSIHQKEPVLIPYETLGAIKQLTKTISEFLRAKAVSDQIQFFDLENINTNAWVNQLFAQNPPQSLFFSSPLAKFFGAQGFAFFNGASWMLEGDVPNLSALIELSKKLSKEKSWGIFQTDCLAAEHPKIAAKNPGFSGITLAWCHARSTQAPYFAIWNKKEITSLVTWGNKTIFPSESSTEKSFAGASPHTSFGLWQESMSMHSEPWSKESQFVARNLLNLLMTR